jgi:uroporphyrinogen-III synthase
MIPPDSQQQSLQGVRVLVTRASHQADNLCRLIEERGGVALRFPVLRIVPSGGRHTLADMGRRLADYGLAIFVSTNAVRMGVEGVLADGRWPSTVRIAAVGARTASALEEAGLPAHIAPRDQFTSEALLDLKPMREVEGLRILIVRGEGGRETLANTLRERGARVDYLEVYRRVQPDADTRPVIDAWVRGEIDAVTISSNQSLQNLYDMLGEVGWPYLRRSVLVVGSQRTAELAASLGITAAPVIADNASDEAIVAALEAWWDSQQSMMPPVEDSAE